MTFNDLRPCMIAAARKKAIMQVSRNNGGGIIAASNWFESLDQDKRKKLIVDTVTEMLLTGELKHGI